MNREIKFRAWDGGNMYEWGHLADIAYRTDFAEAWGNDLTIYKIMQYTGLKDKNGKEIYEGDIVYANHVYPNAVVEYSAPSFLLTTKLGSCSDFGWHEWENFEVIGNIYENPQLLSTEE